MNRSWVIDLMKVLAAQMIVVHHFVIYSPMADLLSTQWPAWVAWLDDHGRLAVQPFLVIGGYLAAMSIGRRQPGPFWVGVSRRYWRLMPPLAISLGLVVLVTWSFGHHLEGADWVSPLPSMGTFLAHLFMLQDVLGLASISAGVCYIAIDLQLFALFLLLHKIGAIYFHRFTVDLQSFMVAALTLVSIHGLSRLPWLDIWAIYFFSAYGLGVLVAWSKAHQSARGWLALTVALLLLDILWDPRIRSVCALFAAGFLWLWGQSRTDGTQAWVRFLHRAGDGSYAIFVSHFSVIILSSAVWELLQPQDSGVVGWFLLGTWLLTLTVGLGVDRGAQRLNAWLQRKLLDKHPNPAASVFPRSRR